jgi:hypothetical protein
MILRSLLFLALVGSSLAGTSAARRAQRTPRAYRMYYTARLDLRRCASPQCGGFWLSSLYGRGTRCADGTRASECYVAGFDVSTLALSETDEDKFGAEVGNGGVVIGTYVRHENADYDLADLKVDAGWAPFQASKREEPTPVCNCQDDEICIYDPALDCAGCNCDTICVRTDPIVCGGIASLPCPEGLMCVDDPTADCDVDCGDVDCPQTCVSVGGDEVSPCAGFAGVSCGIGESCFDIRGDACSAACGGADCGGQCVQEIGAQCGGFAGTSCGPGLVCLEPLGDGCDTECGGADCIGMCLPTNTGYPE